MDVLDLFGREKRTSRFRRGAALLFSCLLCGSVALLGGCDREKTAKPPSREAVPNQPTLRIYAVAGAAGAVEPCGCVKDMLGGVDHAAAWIASQKKTAPHSIVVGAGPMFFEDPQVKESHREQSLFKAEALAQSLHDLGLSAWAPGANDWAFGKEQFSALTKATGARALAANLPQAAGPVMATHVVESGGIRVGMVGISVPEFSSGKVEFPVGAADQALKSGVAELQKKGAGIIVALIAAPRGQALRLVEDNRALHLAILGKPYDQGEANDQPFAPELIGETLVTQAPNHLQAVSVIDLFVRDGDFTFADGTGLSALAKRASLDGRISDLKARLSDWKSPDSGVSAKDIEEREKELALLRKERQNLSDPEPPKDGSFFLYELTEVRESHGEDDRVASRLVAYYRKVNDHNKKLFAGKMPPEVAAGQSSYVGVAICSSCHLEERAFWDKTRHAGAYETLASDHKEFNLDCVSCHVTGYEKPGGSTVTHVEKLTDVQCEVCHGPGSRHVENPADLDLIKLAPPQSMCASTCHHPPHVGADWSVDKAWPKILGVGHQVEKKKE